MNKRVQQSCPFHVRIKPRNVLYTTCYTSTKKKKEKRKSRIRKTRERKKLIQNCPQQVCPRKMIRCIRGNRICRVLSSFSTKVWQARQIFWAIHRSVSKRFTEFLRGWDLPPRKTSRGAEPSLWANLLHEKNSCFAALHRFVNCRSRRSCFGNVSTMSNIICRAGMIVVAPVDDARPRADAQIRLGSRFKWNCFPFTGFIVAEDFLGDSSSLCIDRYIYWYLGIFVNFDCKDLERIFKTDFDPFLWYMDILLYWILKKYLELFLYFPFANRILISYFWKVNIC